MLCLLVQLHIVDCIGSGGGGGGGGRALSLFFWLAFSLHCIAFLLMVWEAFFALGLPESKALLWQHDVKGVFRIDPFFHSDR